MMHLVGLSAALSVATYPFWFPLASAGVIVWLLKSDPKYRRQKGEKGVFARLTLFSLGYALFAFLGFYFGVATLGWLSLCTGAVVLLIWLLEDYMALISSIEGSSHQALK